MPLERDEGEYAYFAQRLLHGDLPYRDMFNQKPPGTFLAYLPPVKLFGTSVAAIHVTMYLWTAAAAVFVYLIGRRLAGRLAAACSVLFFALLTIEPTWLATAANTEQFLLLPMAASVWCAMRAVESRRRLWWLGCGALAMAACAFKQVAATHFVFLAGYGLASWWREKPRRPASAAALDAAATLTGAAAAAALTLGSFEARGILPDFLDAVLWHNVQYASTMTLSAGLAALRWELRSQAAALWPFWLAATLAVFDLRRSSRRITGFLAGLLLTAAAGASVGLYFRAHYFVQLAVALALAAGVGAARLSLLAGETSATRRKLAGVLVPLGLILAPLVRNGAFFFASMPAEKSRLLYGANPFDVAPEIAAHIQERTAAADTVLIYGSEPEILFLANRKSATRYIIFYPLMLPGEQAEGRQRQAWAEIQRSSPRCVLMTELGASLLEDSSSPGFLRRQLVEDLRGRYVLDGVRLFESGTLRMLFGEQARRTVFDTRRSPSPPPIDMLLFCRR